MEASRKPLAKVEGRRRMPLSGLTIAWRGTPNLGDWVAYIVRTKSKKFLLVDHASERTVNTLLSRLKTMSKKEVEQLAKVYEIQGIPFLLGSPFACIRQRVWSSKSLRIARASRQITWGSRCSPPSRRSRSLLIS